MTRLEELTKGTVVEGIEYGGPVTVVGVEWSGDDALELVYKNASGGVDNILLYRYNEPQIKLVSSTDGWTFRGDGELFRLVNEAHRLSLAHLFDPYQAVHSSVIEPLPHQISAVYEKMLPRQPLRFLLADDPGAGKTIMAGLLMKELFARGNLERCLVCCPGSLTEQWQDELYQKFGLRFEMVARQQIEESPSGNPYAEKDFVIARLDHMSRSDSVQEKLKQTEWDLIVVDEAHKMSASYSGGEISETKRYRLGRLLSGLSRHFLLLTATPHNGKDEDFQLFLRLLDSDRFEGRFRKRTRRPNVEGLMRRTIKEELRRFDGTYLFPPREAFTVTYQLSPAEERLYEEVTDYVREEFNRAESLKSGRVRTVGFALTVLQRRLASSPEAIYRSLVRRRERLQAKLEDESKKVRQAAEVGQEPELNSLTRKLQDTDEARSDEVEEAEEQVLDLATAALTLAELEEEIRTLRRLERIAAAVRESGRDRKWEELSNLLRDNPQMFDDEGHRRKIIIFTEHRDTLTYLTGRIRALLGESTRVVTVMGGMTREARRAAQTGFLESPDVSVLVATDAAGEGVNLQ
ncbi:MAG: Superfamily II DNA/RNA helicases, SNF2 family, partial [uncultured Chloroflexia bacterium]